MIGISFIVEFALGWEDLFEDEASAAGRPNESVQAIDIEYRIEDHAQKYHVEYGQAEHDFPVDFHGTFAENTRCLIESNSRTTFLGEGHVCGPNLRAPTVSRESLSV